MMVTRGARTPRMATRGGGRAEVGAARAGHLEVAHVRVQIGARWQARGLRQVCRARWRRPAAYDALRRGRAHHLQRERNERAKPPVAPRSARRAAPRTRRRRCRAQRLSSRGQLAVPRLLRPVLLRVSVHVHGPTLAARLSVGKSSWHELEFKGGVTTIKKWSQPSQTDQANHIRRNGGGEARGLGARRVQRGRHRRGAEEKGCGGEREGWGPRTQARADEVGRRNRWCSGGAGRASRSVVRVMRADAAASCGCVPQMALQMQMESDEELARRLQDEDTGSWWSPNAGVPTADMHARWAPR